MARTAALYVVGAGALAGFWLRLEQPRARGGETLAVAVLALLPALLGSPRLRAAAAVAAVAVVATIAFDLPRQGPLGTLWDRFSNGLLDFYDYRLPIDPRIHPWMHGVLLCAIFGFCLAFALAVAARRAGLAVALLVLGAGWPATILPGGRTSLHGALILAAALTVLAGLTVRPTAKIALPVGAALLVAGIGASGTAAVAKEQLLHWQRWDFYTRPQSPVSVRYVWDYNYRGIRFPKKVTTVLKAKAPPTSLYWRATTLDDFDGIGWRENIVPTAGEFDPLLPAEARDQSRWVRAEMTVAALRDYHLVGASVPVAYNTGVLPVQYATDGVALVVPRGLARDDSYTAFSYSPQPKPAELVREPARYPSALRRFVEVAPGVVVPFFGTPGRDDRLDYLFAGEAATAPYAVVYRRARSLAGSTRSPYAAALAIETFLRRSGGFAYTTQPPPYGARPPLVDFLTRTKAGYCQHFAGAMTLMLRYLGIPARVAAGFVSGKYDPKQREWTITDHDAHTWVEVWFPSYGWLPFDPTPGRGALTAAYTVSSRNFDGPAAQRVLGGTAFEQRLAGGFFERQSSAFTRSAGDIERTGRIVPRQSENPLWNLLRLLGVLVAAALVLIVLVKVAVRRLRFLTRDPRRVAGACRRELADFLADQRIAVPRSATLHELGARVREELDVDAGAFVAAATAARFGPSARAGGAAARARHELRRLERTIRRRLGIAERARGLVSLRSLGFS